MERSELERPHQATVWPIELGIIKGSACFGSGIPLYPNYNRPGNPGKRNPPGAGGQAGQFD
jgi:hypothetical protein